LAFEIFSQVLKTSPGPNRDVTFTTNSKSKGTQYIFWKKIHKNPYLCCLDWLARVISPVRCGPKFLKTTTLVVVKAVGPKLFLIAYHLWVPYCHYLVPGKVSGMWQIQFDQKFGKPEFTQMQHEENGCEKV